MDPLGLAFENFNALGMWRESERKAPIDPTGILITANRSRMSANSKDSQTQRRDDFYRRLTEKPTYALGRGGILRCGRGGQIVEKLKQDGGKFRPC
jgi:hypothetical protein